MNFFMKIKFIIRTLTEEFFKVKTFFDLKFFNDQTFFFFLFKEVLCVNILSPFVLLACWRWRGRTLSGAG